jgi:hypothetical protein
VRAARLRRPLQIVLAQTQPASPPEFRSYRRFVSWFVLSFIVVGSVYLLTSVGVSIYRRRHVVTSPDRVSAQVTDAEIRSCFDELDDVRQGLAKHLENFHHLLASYDRAEVQRWDDEGNSWRQGWKALGQRCRFNELPQTHLRRQLEQMTGVYLALGDTYDLHTRAVKRFGTDLAPRMDDINDRMKKIGERLNQPASSPGENKP